MPTTTYKQNRLNALLAKKGSGVKLNRKDRRGVEKYTRQLRLAPTSVTLLPGSLPVAAA
jgi:hypothetical protein